jgi:hypothetical protein
MGSVPILGRHSRYISLRKHCESSTGRYCGLQGRDTAARRELAVPPSLEHSINGIQLSFLGNGLILPGIWEGNGSPGRRLGRKALILGLKSSDHSEGIKMLKDPWCAIHDVCCDCRPKVNEEDETYYDTDHPLRSSTGEEIHRPRSSINEADIDRVLDRLCLSGEEAKGKEATGNTRSVRKDLGIRHNNDQRGSISLLSP